MIVPIGQEVNVPESAKLIDYWFNDYFYFYLMLNVIDNDYLAD